MDGRPKHGCIHISQNAEHFFINKTLFSSRILLCNVLSGLGPFRQRLTYAHNIHNTRVQYIRYIMAISFVFFVLPHTATSCTIDN